VAQKAIKDPGPTHLRFLIRVDLLGHLFLFVVILPGIVVSLLYDVLAGRVEFWNGFERLAICVIVWTATARLLRHELRFPLAVRGQKRHFKLTGVGSGATVAIGPLDLPGNTALYCRMSFKAILPSFKLVSCPRDLVCEMAIASEIDGKFNIHDSVVLRKKFSTDERNSFGTIFDASAYHGDDQKPAVVVVRIRYSPDHSGEVRGDIKISLVIVASLSALWLSNQEHPNVMLAQARTMGTGQCGLVVRDNSVSG
jgi:hypothetical protein